MGQTTKIEWCDSTLNLMMGCDGCELWNPAAGVKHCYAGAMTERYAGTNTGFPPAFESPKLFVERLNEALRWPDLTGKERPDKPWLNGRPRIVFLNDMGDTFTESLPDDWLAQVLPLLAESPHRYLILTKRSKRMLDFTERHPLPSNVWPGVSVTSQATIGRIADMMKIQSGGPKWVSAEPLLGMVEFAPYWTAGSVDPFALRDMMAFPEWIVLGGESGPGSRYLDLRWIRQPLAGFVESGVPVFVKQLGDVVREPYYMEDDERRSMILDGQYRVMQDVGGGEFAEWTHQAFGQPSPGSMFEYYPGHKGGDPTYWPADLRVREFPVVGA